MTKFVPFATLYAEMQIALKQFGIDNDFDIDVVNATIHDNNVITTLVYCYDSNEHNIDTTDMLTFLKKLNDIEMNGVIENFHYYDNE